MYHFFVNDKSYLRSRAKYSWPAFSYYKTHYYVALLPVADRYVWALIKVFSSGSPFSRSSQSVLFFTACVLRGVTARSYLTASALHALNCSAQFSGPRTTLRYGTAT